MIADKTYCLTEDRKKVVDETDPKAAFLLVGKGSEIDDKTATKYGILKTEKEKETRAVKPEEITKR